MKFRVFYMRPEFFRDGIMGPEQNQLPNPANIEKTHIALTDKEAPSLSRLFWEMQGEYWSPKGQAKPLIERRGLSHTSMSVGDIAVGEDGIAYMVDRIGWFELGHVPAVSPV